MARRIEKGSVVGFVLIGALLAAMLVGGVWLATHSLDGSSGSSSDEVAVDEGGGQAAQEGDVESDATTDEELKDTLSQQAGQSSNNTQYPSTGVSTSLPVTGPEDALLQLGGAMLLVSMSVAYLRSRSIA
jgi:hypothetical protein